MLNGSLDNNVVIGWLGKAWGMLSGSFSGRGVPVYHYGYPRAGTLEPDVQVQWDFNEAASPLVDEVIGLSCALRTGTATYGVNCDWAGIGKGITTLRNINNQYFWNTGLVAQLDTTGQDMTYESIYKPTASVEGAVQTLFEESPYGVTYSFNTSAGAKRFSVRIIYDDATSQFSNYTGLTWDENTTYKTRSTFDRNGNSETFLNGISLGTFSIAAGDGKNISPVRVVLAGPYSSVPAAGGTSHEIRKSLNLTNNSGGPNGG